MALTPATVAPSRITAEDERSPVAFAAGELRFHLGFLLANGEPGTGVRLLAGDAGSDAFTVRVDPDEVVVAGDNPRGALNGVYWLLEQLGFAWVEPGDGGITFSPGHSLAEGTYRESPGFPRRTLILGQDSLHDDWREWLEWASRNRYNDLFFHDTPPSVWDRAGASRPATAEEIDADGFGWMFERWDADGSAIVEEAAKRGMTLQFGGHHLPTLVPRDEFEHHPDWFPLRKGVRDPRYNICTAAPALRDFLARRVEEFVGRFPGADVYHFWGDDIRGGGWCECTDCGGTSASDQALVAINVIAETVERLLPRTRVAHLAYHDTVEPPQAVRPRDNVTLLWAPRERCYAHAIADGTCERNREQYWRPFTGLLDVFDREPGRIQAFEYYSDAVLFKGLAPTHLRILPEDARAYHKAGVANLQNLMVGDRPWVGPPWHAWWFANCAWNQDAVAEIELPRFCAGAYGEAAPVMANGYRDAERAYRQLLDLHDLERLSRHDVLDYSDCPRGTLTRKADELRQSAGLLLQLPGRIRGRDGCLAAEHVQAEFVADVARHLAHRLTAWDLALDNKPEDALQELELAEAALRDIEAWDARHNAPAYANLTGRMRRGMSYHCMEIGRLLKG